jgi:DNA-binding PadR family transcriptional regulator
MTSKEFVIWLKGFTEGVHEYNLTPKQWDALKEKLEEVNDISKTPPCSGHDQESWNEEELERRMDIIGQNGNEGLHYNAEDLGGNWVTTTTNKLKNNG